jgi:hypothetical protein
MSWFRRHYGSGPGHLLLVLACFALSGYVASQIVQVPQAARIAVWFVGAAIAHDLVLWPLYTLADRLSAAVRRRRSGATGRVAWVNHVRVPAVISGFLLAISFPLVLGWSGQTYRRATGLSPAPYTNRWLAVTGALFAASAVAYGGRVAWSRFRRG